MRKAITTDDLRHILARCVGIEEDGELEGEILDQTFEALGYDSLALMETAAVLQREFGVVIPDDELFNTDTPRALLDRANRAVANAG
ncbi:acyl carrier protein [Streptantibioticus ferralitis]|uniref:Acyl carrier protein n=1 Tax=Streptantibioticus ferralitis TaxID=236510 RepID=A0ABT5YY85_9ACTN|nr:acyl carrier protein [Streptantibioticus ferralitis]MDF2256505.1 acyl carrier protein [Streptantibioticus ferralitis]